MIQSSVDGWREDDEPRDVTAPAQYWPSLEMMPVLKKLDETSYVCPPIASDIWTFELHG